MWGTVTVRRALPALLTVPQVAQALKVTVETVRAMIRSGRLQALRPGLRCYRITRAELERCMREQMAKRGRGSRSTGADSTSVSSPASSPKPLAIAIAHRLPDKDPTTE